MSVIKKIFAIFFCIILFMPSVYANTSEDPTSLKEYREYLAGYEAKKDSYIAKRKAAEKQINKYEKEIETANKNIEKKEKQIEESKAEIKRLNAEIESKSKEIDNLLSFLQISDGDNVYLEYVFGAQSFTDFIYRSAVVEQMSVYNENLISEMKDLIEENKKLQLKLDKEIEDLENVIVDLEKTLKKSNIALEDISEHQVDVEADIKAIKSTVDMLEDLYEEEGCEESMTMLSCLGVVYSDGFTRPLVRASVTSEYGMRFHPTLHYYRMHNGIDLGVSMGTKVYASAAGVVYKITKKSSCGGNMVWIRHNIKGTEYQSVYQHLHTINVKLGQFVTIQTVVGTSGGGESYDRCSTGPHLHFGIMKKGSYVNPRNYIEFPAKGKRFTARFY